MSDLAGRESRMIRLFTAGAQIALFVAAMAVTVPMVTFAQTTEPASESSPEADTGAVDNAIPTPGAASTDNDMSVQSDPPVGPTPATASEVESQRRLNEFRSEYLDDRADTLNRWLDFVAIVVTFFAVAVALAGFLGFRRFREIETKAKSSVEKVKSSVEAAENLVKEIRETRDESQEILLNLRNLNAESVDKEPERANRVSRDAQNNPEATLVDKAIAQAVSLQQQGRRDYAIKQWRAIAHIAEGSDNDLAARAWLSIGYLAGVESSGDCISAHDKAICLKPDFAAAYNSRGNAKALLGRHDDAIADHNEAIRLQPDGAAAYNSRGASKAALGRHDDAIADYNEAIRLQPAYAAAYTNRGISKAVLGRHGDAIADHNKAIRLKPDDATAYINRGMLKAALGRHDDAIADHNEAIRLQPDDAAAYTSRGNAKAALGRHDDAIADHNEAIRLQPDGAEAYINRGEVKAALGLKAEAQKDFETALELARNANNPNIVRRAEQSLRDLDDAGSRRRRRRR